MSVRERVKRIENNLAVGAVPPELARESLMTLTGLLDGCFQEFREAELIYKPVLLTCLQAGGAANRARIEAECSPEYAALRVAQDTLKAVQQSIVTCRGYLRSLDEEMRLSR